MKIRSGALFACSMLALAIFYLGFLIKNDLILCGPLQFFVEHPIRFSWVSHFFDGNLPWISNAVAGGIPLWSDPNLAIFYPGNLIYLVLPFEQAWNASLIIHLVWGGMGVYWLCREARLPVPAALIGAFTFLFSGSALAALNSNEVLITSSWLPWILGLVHSGLQNGKRRIVVASLALACQWLAGFTFIQAATLILLLVLLAHVFFRTRDRKVFVRFLFLILSALMLTAVQWIPAILWIPQTDARFVFGDLSWKPVPYLGFTSTALFLIGLKNRIVWGALIVLFIDWLLFGGSPVLAISLALGAASGGAFLLRKFQKPVFRLIPVLIMMELLIANLHVPLIVSMSQIRKMPPEVTQDLRRWNLHCTAAKSGLFPLAGLHWGVDYGTPPDGGLMLWTPLPIRKLRVQDAVQTGKNLELLREAGIGYVITEHPVIHRELSQLNQQSTRFFVYRLNTPVYPVVHSKDLQARIRFEEVAPDQIVIKTASNRPFDLNIHRNGLPGWECKVQNTSLPITLMQEGWMKISVPAGTNQLHLTYRTPGSRIGSILTAVGTILILAILVL